jgi:hypothetical protein
MFTRVNVFERGMMLPGYSEGSLAAVMPCSATNNVITIKQWSACRGGGSVLFLPSRTDKYYYF